jgi:GT2 family glycosyltransferase
MKTAPVALFVYKRFWQTKQTVESLKNNDLAGESELFIFSDGFKGTSDEKAVKEVREYIKTIKGFKNISIIEREKNLGLAESVIDGVTTVVNKFGRIIVLEDDMKLGQHFLEFMNEALDMYENNEDVISIHGYIYPVKSKLPDTFFLRGADCWGWATWKRGWDLFEPNSKKLLQKITSRNLEYEFDLDGVTNNLKMLKSQIACKVDSWAIRWYATAFLMNKFTLYPGKSLLKNIGMAEGGTHTWETNIYDTNIYSGKLKLYKIPVKENKLAREAVKKFYISIRPNFIKRYLKKIKHFIKSY